MKVSLWELNQSYQALIRLAGRDIPKEHHKLAYTLARVVRSARSEIELLGESLNDLMCKCGFEPGQADIAPEMLADYDSRAKAFMRENDCEIKGEPIGFEKIAGVVSISALDLALLDWLISDETAKAEE